MRRKRFGLRTITGLLPAGLVAVGLRPGTATAASKAVRGPGTALGESVTAGGSHAGHPAADVTGGSRLSHWEGPAGAFPQWIRVDLGGTVEAGQVVLEPPTGREARTQALSVEGSADGSSFTALSGSTAHRFDSDGGSTATVDFPARDARRIRVRASANTGRNAAQLSEIEVYGDDDGGNPGEPPVDGADLSLGEPIEASSTIHSFVTTNADDGQTGTYWESSVHSATLTVALGADADLSGVVVRLDPDAARAKRTRSIEVLGRGQASDSSTSLKARADCTFDPGAGDGTVTVPVTGRYADVRLRFTHNSGGYGAQVAELQVMGAAAPHPGLVVSDLTWTPASPTETDAVTVRATVRNTGDDALAVWASELRQGPVGRRRP